MGVDLVRWVNFKTDSVVFLEGHIDYIICFENTDTMNKIIQQIGNLKMYFICLLKIFDILALDSKTNYRFSSTKVNALEERFVCYQNLIII